MNTKPQNNDESKGTDRSLYDPEPVAEEDLWFLPGQPEDVAPTDPPWPVAPREGSLHPEDWKKAERSQYQSLIKAVTALTRFHERLVGFPVELRERFALKSVDAALRAEGVWLGVERIALYQALRVAGENEAQDLARASWAVRRLLSPQSDVADLRGFLGRVSVEDASVPGAEDRIVGEDLDQASAGLGEAMADIEAAHALTRSAYLFAWWRREGITPWDETLEPTIAAMIAGAGQGGFVLLSAGQRLDRYGLSGNEASVEKRLQAFYDAVEEGALEALLEIDRLRTWRERAGEATAELSGRTPPRLIDVLLRYPLVSAELVAAEVGISGVSARRNLNLFVERGLVREVTGQERFRFWAVAG